MHCLAKYLAAEFKQVLKSKGYTGDMLSYNKASYGTLNGEVVTIENFIDGKFVKYINNGGTICTAIEHKAQKLVEWLSHFFLFQI